MLLWNTCGWLRSPTTTGLVAFSSAAVFRADVVCAWSLSGLAAVGRCEPGEYTSHRNRRNDRRFLFHPTDTDSREESVGKGQHYFAENGSFINISGIFLLNESDRNTTFQFRRLFGVSDPVPLPRRKAQSAPSSSAPAQWCNRACNPPLREGSGDGQTYLWSVDFDGHVVALRRPLGGFSHFEACTNQIDTELALKQHIRTSFNRLFTGFFFS